MQALDNLVRIGQLKKEPPSRAEFEGLLRSGTARLEDAANEGLSLYGRFDLAYNAAHAGELERRGSLEAPGSWAGAVRR